MALSRKGFMLIFFIILLGIVGAMSILGSNGSILVYAITEQLLNWKELIGLGVALAVVFMFLPRGRQMLGM